MPNCSLVRGVYVVRFTPAEVQSGNGEEIEGCMYQAVSGMPPGTRTVLLDLEGVPFLRSSGLGAMLSLCDELKPKGVRLAVCRVPVFGRNLFKIARLDEHLLIFPSVEAGVAALGWGDSEEEQEGEPSPSGLPRH